MWPWSEFARTLGNETQPEMITAGNRIFIVGASGHGLVAADAARRAGWEVVGFLDSFKPTGQVVRGIPILGHPDNLADLLKAHEVHRLFLGISDNWTRQQMAARLRAAVPAFELTSIVHPQSVVATDVVLGQGTLVLAGAIINSGCLIAENCIINTKASLDHDGEMRACASLLPGVTTGGNCVIGECACVCVGATLSHKISVGDHTVVGAGAVVLHDVPPCSLAYGVPARVVRSRQPGERHF